MANIVAGFCLPHDPLITSMPDAPPKEAADRVIGAFAEVRERIRALNADTVIVIGDDHCAMFHPTCQPRILIGVGDIEGPLEQWLRIPRRAVSNNAPLADHLMKYGFRNGFDWAVAKTLVLDHSTMIPLHLAVPDGLSAIPIYISSGMEPIIDGDRCRQLGEMIGRAVAEWPGDERVVLLGTGGISHWVGMADAGRVNIEFDRKILGLVVDGNIDALVAYADRDVIKEGGNGGLEIRNWIVAMGALPGNKAKVIAYEPVSEWITGLGFAELMPAA